LDAKAGLLYRREPRTETTVRLMSIAITSSTTRIAYHFGFTLGSWNPVRTASER